MRLGGTVRVPLISGTLSVVSLLLVGIPIHLALADGSLPPLPYRYLHPPAALAGTNRKPDSGLRTISVQNGQSSDAFVFTRDGQAGMSAPAGAFTVPTGVTTIVLSVVPVESPPGLPSGLGANGNAYRVEAIGMPGRKTVDLKARADLTMRWPHIPTAVFEYRNGRWAKLCSSDKFILSSSTVSCQISSTGIFTSVVLGTSNIKLPVTPISQSRWAFLNRYIPLIAALILIVAAAIAAWLISRSRREEDENQEE